MLAVSSPFYPLLRASHRLLRPVKHFNFSWQDMTVPTLPKMFDIVSIAVAELTNGGKVSSVPCGLGVVC